MVQLSYSIQGISHANFQQTIYLHHEWTEAKSTHAFNLHKI